MTIMISNTQNLKQVDDTRQANYDTNSYDNCIKNNKFKNNE